ncbi:hypothetical protein [Nonlabens spongiae]|uniref:hypothetical protein n=1 Tax=Nonlabens spongiae TaxID=331648 RepID=UPI00146CA823|nr:hypothetical protein [Nonlabens spongiae]
MRSKGFLFSGKLFITARSESGFVVTCPTKLVVINKKINNKNVEEPILRIP